MNICRKMAEYGRRQDSQVDSDDSEFEETMEDKEVMENYEYLANKYSKCVTDQKIFYLKDLLGNEDIFEHKKVTISQV